MNEILSSRPLAQGRTAEVYLYGDGQVLKLFYDWVGKDRVDYEARLTRAAYHSGLPVPAVGEIIQVGERFGLVFERIEGHTMLNLFRRLPWRLNAYTKQFVDLHLHMHRMPSSADLPGQRMVLEWKVSHASMLPRDVQDKLLTELNAMPDGEQVCHGDFHPGNILINTQGATIIDWIDASRGNPLADVARTVIILLEAAAGGQTRNALEKKFLQFFVESYLKAYFKNRPEARLEYRRWLPIVAAARLSENIPEVQGWLLALSRGDQVIIY